MIGTLATRLMCLAATLVATVALVACGGSGDGPSATRAPNYRAALAGAPRPLAELYHGGDRLLPGGTAAFQEQLKRLRGYPVVVNAWASWCGPCRQEFPFLQRLSARFGTRVGFVGVDTGDSSAAGRTFLQEFPLPYPSYDDPDNDVANLIGVTAGLPGTAFYDASGKRVSVKQGQYANQADLAADIKRYAIGG